MKDFWEQVDLSRLASLALTLVTSPLKITFSLRSRVINKSRIKKRSTCGKSITCQRYYKWFLNTFKYRAKLVQAFAFQPVCHESGIFCFERIKACLHHDLSRHMESA